MIAVTTHELPTGAGWALEPKWDGWRCLAFRQERGVRLQSRSGKALTTYFPDITRALRSAVDPGVVLDGELVIWDQQRGRSSFAALQRRVTSGRHLLQQVRRAPAHYVVFDVLATTDGPVLRLPLADRRALLEELLAGAPPEIVVCPQTTDPDVVDEWLETWTETGIEGVVAKRLDHRYTPGRRGWRKLRTRSTTEAIVGGVTGAPSNPDTVLVGRLDSRGRLRYTGRSLKLTEVQRAELAPLLRRPVAQRHGVPVTHPWPQPLPASWSGQWDRPADLPYVQVEPDTVVEILVDTAFEWMRWRHRVKLVRPRRDMSVFDVPIVGADD